MIFKLTRPHDGLGTKGKIIEKIRELLFTFKPLLFDEFLTENSILTSLFFLTFFSREIKVVNS